MHAHAHAEAYSLSCWSGTFVSWRFAPLGLDSEQPFIKMSLDLSSAANQHAERLQEGSSGWSRAAGRLLHTQTEIIPGDLTVTSGQNGAVWSQTLIYFSFFSLIPQRSEIRSVERRLQCCIDTSIVGENSLDVLPNKGNKGVICGRKRMTWTIWIKVW